jgi:predicted nucleic acid-binding protein
MRPQDGLLDTSVLIAGESGRPLDTDRLPVNSWLSVVTIGELHVGIHTARDVETRARRMATLSDTADIDLLDIDEEVCIRWAMLRARLTEAGRNIGVNDLWIAATALASDMPVVTQDADFDTVEGIGGLRVVRV